MMKRRTPLPPIRFDFASAMPYAYAMKRKDGK